jgi:hypothetical protein
MLIEISIQNDIISLLGTIEQMEGIGRLAPTNRRHEVKGASVPLRWSLTSDFDFEPRRQPQPARFVCPQYPLDLYTSDLRVSWLGIITET